MNKILTIAGREYNAVVRSKAFIVSIILLPVMMFSSFFIQKLSQTIHDVNDRHIAMIDRTIGEQLFPAIARRVEQQNAQLAVDPLTGEHVASKLVLEKVTPVQGKDAIEQQRFELSERIRQGKLLGVLDIGADVMDAVIADSVQAPDAQSVGYMTNNPTALDFRDLASRIINQTIREKRLTAAGISPDKFDQFITPVRVVSRGLVRKEAGVMVHGEAGRDIIAFLVPFGLVMLMFMVVVIGAVPLIQGIAEEKQNRIAEVLLGSLSPFSLMAGKVLGLVATSFTLILFYLGGAYFAVHRLHLGEYLPGHVMAFFVLFQMLAVLMYGSLYIAIGASCNDPNQMQSLLMPVNLLMAMPLIMMMAIIQSPTGPLARIMTFFPPSTPFVTVARMAVPPGMSAMEIIAAIAVMIATAVVMVWASGRVFRVGILLQGKSPNLKQLLKWVISG